MFFLFKELNKEGGACYHHKADAPCWMETDGHGDDRSDESEDCCDFKHGKLSGWVD